MRSSTIRSGQGAPWTASKVSLRFTTGRNEPKRQHDKIYVARRRGPPYLLWRVASLGGQAHIHAPFSHLPHQAKQRQSCRISLPSNGAARLLPIPVRYPERASPIPADRGSRKCIGPFRGAGTGTRAGGWVRKWRRRPISWPWIRKL
jgi:hypothetical protein